MCLGDSVVHCTGKTLARSVRQRSTPWSRVSVFLVVAMGWRRPEQCSHLVLTVVLAIAGTVLKLPVLSYYGPVVYTGDGTLMVAALQ